MTANLVLIRHGESEANAQGWLAGERDVQLTDHGRSQARAIEPWVRQVAPNRVVTSDLCRARETAAIVGLTDVEVRPAWREAMLGSWEGRFVAELALPALDAWRSGRVTPPGAESAEAVARRAVDDLRHITEPGATTMVVTHGGVIRALCRSLLGVDGLVPVGPASLTWLQLGPNVQPRLQHYNATPGLVAAHVVD